jgi:hypothetical protein
MIVPAGTSSLAAAGVASEKMSGRRKTTGKNRTRHFRNMAPPWLPLKLQ